MRTKQNFISAAELARRLGVDPSSITRKCAAGIIPASRLPGKKSRWRIAESFQALLDVAETNSDINVELPKRQSCNE